MARRSATVSGVRKQRRSKVAKTSAKSPRRKPASVAELRAQMTATSRVLELIAKSPSNLQPVFDAIVQTVVQLVGCETAFIQRCDGRHFWSVARCRREDGLVTVFDPRHAPIDPNANFPSRAIVSRTTLHLPDWSQIELPEFERRIQEQLGYQSAVYLPLLREAECIGVLGLAGSRPGMFGETEITLAESFRDQALIAIENTRLFNEVQTKTHDLEESLQQQTATSEVLQAINRSVFDLKTVLQTLLESAARLCDASICILFQSRGDLLHVGASYGGTPEFVEYLTAHPHRFDRTTVAGRTAVERRTVHIPDIAADTEYGLPQSIKLGGWQSIIGVPLLRNGEVLGVLDLARPVAGPFTPRQIELIETFADQAVIAIENARLFDEVQARTRDLTESLQQQTATTDVLKVISRSAFDLEAVFETVVERSARLSGVEGARANIFRYDGELLRITATYNVPPKVREWLEQNPIRPGRHSGTARAALERRTIHVPDVLADPEYTFGVKALEPYRTILGVPIIKANDLLGVLLIYLLEFKPFDDKQISLIETFADQAAIAIENTRLFNETKQALERQTATADILKVIASSPDDVQPVFEAIASSARRLIGGFSTAVHLVIDDMVHLVAYTPTTPEADAILIAAHPRHRSEVGAVALVENGEIAELADSETADPHTRQLGRARGWRSVTLTPLMNQGRFIGFIASTRREPGVLADHQLELLRTFADQAVIAIQNARLFNETKEALERQTATADILKVIASSPSDTQPVFEAIVGSAARLFQPCAATITTLKDGKLHWNAIAEVVRSFDHEAAEANYPIAFDPERSPSAQAMLQRRIIQIPDVSAPDTPESTRRIALAGGFKSITFVPLVHNDKGIGTIILTHPTLGFRHSGEQLALIQTFADQAVIAIQNARLFNETREALERQTATSDILNVIASSPTDTRPVFDAIASRAKNLVGGFSSTVFRFIDGQAQLEAFTPTTPEADEVLTSSLPRPAADFAPFRLTRSGEVMQIPDTESLTDQLKDVARARGYRSMLFAPLLNKGASIGCIGVTRVQPGQFAEDHVQLLKTFADQAVIAIENVRLFDEVQAKTRDLQETLQQQTATADVLRIISRSVAHAAPVFDTILESCEHLFHPFDAAVYLIEGDRVRGVARRGHGEGEWGTDSMPLEGSSTGLAIAQRRAIHYPDLADKADLPEDKRAKVREIGGMTVLYAPMISQESGVGSLVVTRRPKKPFTDAEIALIQTFADQAVIAIENVRLFDEVQAKTRDLEVALQQQTATADVLKVISRSAFDLDTVLTTLAESARAQCRATGAYIVMREGDELRFHVIAGKISDEFTDMLRAARLRVRPDTLTGRAVATGEVVHIADVPNDTTLRWGAERELGEFRSGLSVPLILDGERLGAFVIGHRDINAFTPDLIELVKTFADQAIIAIKNARLFEQVQARTQELSKSLEDLRTAQDRLVQTEKLASLGQLTAGIAHEIKNPLNFVNNFSALSAELIDELDETLAPAPLDQKMRDDVGELTGMLKSNLQRVVQHGKRADSIVKNMLQHSREGSGERRTQDLNALVSESLNLA